MNENTTEQAGQAKVWKGIAILQVSHSNIQNYITVFFKKTMREHEKSSIACICTSTRDV
jgi:hypothetical protein